MSVVEITVIEIAHLRSQLAALREFSEHLLIQHENREPLVASHIVDQVLAAARAAERTESDGEATAAMIKAGWDAHESWPNKEEVPSIARIYRAMRAAAWPTNTEAQGTSRGSVTEFRNAGLGDNPAPSVPASGYLAPTDGLTHEPNSSESSLPDAMPEEPTYLRLRNGFSVNIRGEQEPLYGEYVLRKDYDKLRAHCEVQQREISNFKERWIIALKMLGVEKTRAEAAEARANELHANGERLKEAADGWKTEAERLRGIERALERAEAELAKLRPIVEAAEELLEDEPWATIEECKHEHIESGPGNRLASAFANLTAR